LASGVGGRCDSRAPFGLSVIIARVDPALASLLGADVGGVIGGGSNVGLDWIRAKARSNVQTRSS
jgi:hypothetical protein